MLAGEEGGGESSLPQDVFDEQVVVVFPFEPVMPT